MCNDKITDDLCYGEFVPVMVPKYDHGQFVPEYAGEEFVPKVVEDL